MSLAGGPSLAQRVQFLGQLLYPFVAIGDHRLHFLDVEPQRDMLWAVRIPRRNREHDCLLDARPVAIRFEPLVELLIALNHACLAPDLYSLAVPIIDKEDKGLWVLA